MAQLGSGNDSGYPNVIDTKQTFVNSPASSPDSASRLDAELANDSLHAIINVQTALGARPQGNFGSLAARLQQFLPGGGETPLFFGFTAATTVTIPGTAHNLGTPTLLYQAYDDNTPRNAIEAARTAVSQLTYEMVLTFATPQSGAVSLAAPSPQYTTTFTNQTVVTVLGATHLFGTADLFVQVYALEGTEQVAITPATSINRTTFDVTITFATPQSGAVIVSNLGPRYVTNFTNQTSVAIPGGLHALATPALLFQVFDDAPTARNIIQLNTFSVDPTSFDVLVSFVTPQSGRIIIGQASAITGSDFEIRNAGATDLSAVRVMSEDGNVVLQSGASLKGVVFENNVGALVAFLNSEGWLEILGNAIKPGGGPWLSTSDVRVKKDITPFTDGLAQIRQLTPVWFRYNGLAGIRPTGQRHTGFLAHDVEPVAPYLVGRTQAKLRSRDAEPTELLTFDGEAIVPLLVNTIKELAVRLDELHQRVLVLEAHLRAQAVPPAEVPSL